MIVDAHAHIFHELHGLTGQGATRSLTYGKALLGDQVFQMTPPMMEKTAFPPEALLANMDWAGVDKTVLLQGSYYGEANATVAEAVRRWPDRFAGAAFIDPRANDARDTFLRCVEDYGFRILKFEISVGTGLVGLYPDLRLDEDSMAWVWEEAEQRGLVMTLDLGAVGSTSYQTDAVQAMLARHPRLKVVICHLAQPPVARGDDAALGRLWQEQIQLATQPNVWFDLSALPAYASAVEAYPYPRACEYIRRAVERIGVDRLMWGTDAPGLLAQATYPQLLTFVRHHFSYLAPDDLAAVMGETARHVYGV
ncbi:MAG: amidohydrolase family protein [Anaerolineae bacterium]|nr:amidohydrolase family protein [Anaerolineae bacterium]